jgi:hypothetical protein
MQDICHAHRSPTMPVEGAAFKIGWMVDRGLSSCSRQIVDDIDIPGQWPLPLEWD